MSAAAFGILFGAGLALIVFSGALVRILRSARAKRASEGQEAPPAETRRAAPRLRLGPVAVVQLLAATGGMFLGWVATGLMGMAMLLGGLGALLPPFMAAPGRRRRQTREALAWSTWSRPRGPPRARRLRRRRPGAPPPGSGWARWRWCSSSPRRAACSWAGWPPG
jgi:hypothetical protein